MVQPLPPPDAFVDTVPRSISAGEERGQSLEAFQTSLPMRLDHEAMLAYLLLPPAGGVLLLLLEHKSDYVRFHAWQCKSARKFCISVTRGPVLYAI